MNLARLIRVRFAPLTLALVLASPAAFAEDLTFTFHNKSSYAVAEFYASPADVNNWEDDILGTDILPAGESVDITIADGRSQCVYDFKVVVEDGTTLERGGVDICELGSYTLTD
ncbi:MAG TPA: hypothetical protein VEA16_04870 [Vicinamibacterales bacterium]|nr:hypothetical protein [Vicinamibacterales bacterium]